MTFAGLATLGLAAVAQLAVSPAASSAESVTVPAPYTVAINPGNLLTQASLPGCNQDDMSSVPSDKDGWLFIASPDDFVTFKAIFDSGSVTMTSQSDTDATKKFTKNYDHLLVVTSPGSTLLNAYATLSGDRDFFVLSHTCAARETVETPSPTVSPTCAIDMDTNVEGCQTESPAPSESPCAEDIDTETEGCQTESPSVLPTEISQSPCTEDMDTETPGCQTESETPSAEVSATEFTNSPTPSASVKGVKVVRTPAVEGSRLPFTGSVLPVGLLLLLGLGLVAGGVLTTIAGETRTATTEGKHRA